jgi:hypothetical protein
MLPHRKGLHTLGMGMIGTAILRSNTTQGKNRQRRETIQKGPDRWQPGPKRMEGKERVNDEGFSIFCNQTMNCA